jgi:uncharacterized protein YndB with AHSA1/START domain
MAAPAMLNHMVEGHRTDAVVRLERTIPASPRQVYRAWLDPELLSRWLAPGGMAVARAEVDERVGGRFRIRHTDSGADVGGFECEILELDPDRRLVFRWGFAGPESTDGPVFDSLLTITLRESDGDSTTLTLVHERLGELAEAMPHVAGSVRYGWESALGKLARTV